MSNRFSARGTSAVPEDLRLSNGGTDAFFDVLTLAGCLLAKTAWQQNLVLYFSDAQRIDRGSSGFDLSELPWTADAPAEKEFFVQLIDTASGRYGWDRLSYDPPRAAEYLAIYRAMLAGFTTPSARPTPSDRPDWRIPPRAALLARCPRHGLYQGEHGCRPCDDQIQPSKASV